MQQRQFSSSSKMRSLKKTIIYLVLIMLGKVTISHAADGNITVGPNRSPDCPLRTNIMEKSHYSSLYNKWIHYKVITCGEMSYMPSAIRLGTGAPPGSWPWHALIRFKIKDKFGMCGGVLIHPQWILTAAHCMVEGSSGSSTYMNLGVTSPDKGYQQHGFIAEIIKHPNYNSDGVFKHDIAMLRVWPALRPTKYVFPICLPGGQKGPTQKELLLGGGTCYITGFGSTTQEYNMEIPKWLQQLEVHVMKDDKCGLYSERDQLSGKRFYVDPRRHICLQLNGSAGSCAGDSGGPLNCFFRRDNKWYVAGLTHYGEAGCRKLRFPDIFTRTSFYKDWIDEIILKSSRS